MDLYKYAKDNQISISEIARQIDITPSYLLRILSGEMKASKKVVRALARVSNGRITESMLVRDTSICRCCGRAYN